jgi:membrane protein YdbS with pleckstrin-like domain
MYEPHHAPLASRREFLRRVARSFGIAVVLIFGSLGVGMWGYHHFETMPWIDAFLNAAMLLGGMGPTKPDLVTRGGKLFAGFYALYAGILVLVAASILIAPIFHRFVHRFHLEMDEQPRKPRARS